LPNFGGASPFSRDLRGLFLKVRKTILGGGEPLFPPNLKRGEIYRGATKGGFSPKNPPPKRGFNF